MAHAELSRLPALPFPRAKKRAPQRPRVFRDRIGEPRRDLVINEGERVRSAFVFELVELAREQRDDAPARPARFRLVIARRPANLALDDGREMVDPFRAASARPGDLFEFVRGGLIAPEDMHIARAVVAAPGALAAIAPRARPKS